MSWYPSPDCLEEELIQAQYPTNIVASPPMVYNKISGALSVLNASTVSPGVVTTLPQTFAGTKTFNGGL